MDHISTPPEKLVGPNFLTFLQKFLSFYVGKIKPWFLSTAVWDMTHRLPEKLNLVKTRMLKQPVLQFSLKGYLLPIHISTNIDRVPFFSHITKSLFWLLVFKYML